MKITCPKCSYQWNTKSKHVYVSCPSCMQKVRIKKKKAVGCPDTPASVMADEQEEKRE